MSSVSSPANNKKESHGHFSWVSRFVFGVNIALMLFVKDTNLMQIFGIATMTAAILGQKFLHKKPVRDLGFRLCTWRQALAGLLLWEISLSNGLVGALRVVRAESGPLSQSSVALSLTVSKEI